MLAVWFERFDRLLTAVNIALMGAMTVLVILAVILRYAFSISFAWSEELIAMTFVLSTAFGAVCAVRRNDHIAIDFIYSWVPPGAIPVVRIAVSLAVILTMAVMIDAALGWIAVSMTVRTPAMQLPFHWFYSALPVSFGLIILYEAVNIARNIHVLIGETRA